MKKEYVIIVEKGKNNLSAYVPDLPGCIATANTEKELLKLMEEGIELHISDMRERGYRILHQKQKHLKSKQLLNSIYTKARFTLPILSTSKNVVSLFNFPRFGGDILPSL